MIHVDAEIIIELIHYRDYFKDPQFFKLFRIFYSMANIPEDAENNVFKVYIDKHSIIKNFHKNFGIESEEIAIRFFNMFDQGSQKH